MSTQDLSTNSEGAFEQVGAIIAETESELAKELNSSPIDKESIMANPVFSTFCTTQFAELTSQEKGKMSIYLLAHYLTQRLLGVELTTSEHDREWVNSYDSFQIWKKGVLDSLQDKMQAQGVDTPYVLDDLTEDEQSFIRGEISETAFPNSGGATSLYLHLLAPSLDLEQDTYSLLRHIRDLARIHEGKAADVTIAQTHWQIVNPLMEEAKCSVAAGLPADILKVAELAIEAAKKVTHPLRAGHSSAVGARILAQNCFWGIAGTPDIHKGLLYARFGSSHGDKICTNMFLQYSGVLKSTEVLLEEWAKLFKKAKNGIAQKSDISKLTQRTGIAEDHLLTKLLIEELQYGRNARKGGA